MTFSWPRRTGAKWALGFGLAAVALFALHLLVDLVSGKPLYLTPLGSALIGVYFTSVVFAGALFLMRLLLSGDAAILAVARTVLDEALRRRVVATFVGLVLIVIPVLPLLVSSEQLRYRVQNFLSYSLGATSLLLSLLTIFLACGTLAGEISGRQIHHAMVKPIGRGTYLLGKWLGVVLLVGLLLAVAGAAIYAGTLLLARQPAGKRDRHALENEVLVARASRRPDEPPSVWERALERLKKTRESDPDVLASLGPREGFKRLLNQERMRWRTVRPGRGRTFTFSGLAAARRQTGQPQLRFKVYPVGSSTGRRLPIYYSTDAGPRRLANRLEVPAGKFFVLPLPSDAIDAAGKLRVTFYNPGRKTLPGRRGVTLQFAAGDGLELLYPVSGFSGNLLRALLIIWLKLAFMGMLGLAAATFLSFPVAVLLSLVVLFAAATSPFVLESIGSYGHGNDDPALFERGAEAVGRGAATLLKKYSEFAPIARVVEGRVVAWSDVLACWFWIAVIWSGVAGLFGWWQFQRRELARVQV